MLAARRRCFACPPDTYQSLRGHRVQSCSPQPTCGAGEVMSGPSLMSAADTAMYVCVLAHIGPQVMAVTVDMNLQFLRAAAKGDLFAEAWVLKLGRRRAALRVMVRDHLGNEACHVTGTYAWPTPL